MKRRQFLSALGASVGVVALPRAFAQTHSPAHAAYGKLLILIELKGANDGLNTLVPYADPAYTTLRPTVQIKRDQVLQLSDRFGLHPALEPLIPLWKSGEMAAMLGLGYPQPNLSHFRSIEIWDTASKANEYLNEGWLARTFAEVAPPKNFLADGVAIGAGNLGPLANGARALSIASTDAFLRQAKLADPHGRAYNKALQHILRLEGDAQFASAQLKPKTDWKTEFPNHGLGQQVKTAMQVASAAHGVAAVHIGLGSFDTHVGQLGTHQNLLKQLAESVVAIKQASVELGRWNDTLAVTYCEFGRRAKENASNGTDHGTANVQFAFGGSVKGGPDRGLKGEHPSLTQLTDDGNFIHTADYRSLYATILRDWWKLPNATAESVLGGAFPSLNFV